MSSGEDDLFGSVSDTGDSPEATEVTETAPERPLNRERLVLPRLGWGHQLKTVYSARVPAFLRLEPGPFDANKIIETHRTEEDFLLEEGTLRWKYARDATTGQITKVANSRIVEWDDGTRTLQLGDEQFEIRTQAPYDTTFVCASQNDRGVYQTEALVDETLTLLPTSTSSATHRKLAEVMARRRISSRQKVGNVFTTEDPEKVQREVERVESQKEKARRKLAAQRDEVVSYTDRAAPAEAAAEDEDEDEEEEEEGEGEEEGLEGDDDDDEESVQGSADEEEMGARLQRAKKAQDADNIEDDSPTKRTSTGSEPPRQRRKIMDDSESD